MVEKKAFPSNTPSILRDLREKYGYSQQEVAEKIAVDRVTYTYYENGKRKVSAEKLAMLAKVYNVTTDYLIGASDESGAGRTKLEHILREEDLTYKGEKLARDQREWFVKTLDMMWGIKKRED